MERPIAQYVVPKLCPVIIYLWTLFGRSLGPFIHDDSGDKRSTRLCVSPCLSDPPDLSVRVPNTVVVSTGFSWVSVVVELEEMVQDGGCRTWWK